MTAMSMNFVASSIIEVIASRSTVREFVQRSGGELCKTKTCVCYMHLAYVIKSSASIVEMYKHVQCTTGLRCTYMIKTELSSPSSNVEGPYPGMVFV